MSVQYKEKIYKIKKKDGLLTLDLSKKKISSLIDIKGLELCADLEKLLLDNNQITEIGGLENLKNLKFLSINHNQIKKITGLDALINLENLDLSYNQIVAVEGFDNLIKLKDLSLSNNNISYIQNLSKLTDLKFIFLFDNPIYNWLKEKLSDISSKAIIEYTKMAPEERQKILNPEILPSQKAIFEIPPEIYVPIDYTNVKSLIPPGEEILYSTLCKVEQQTGTNPMFWPRWESHVLITSRRIVYSIPRIRKPPKFECILWSDVKHLKKGTFKLGLNTYYKLKRHSDYESEEKFLSRSKNFADKFTPIYYENLKMKKKNY